MLMRAPRRFRRRALRTAAAATGVALLPALASIAVPAAGGATTPGLPATPHTARAAAVTTPVSDLADPSASRRPGPDFAHYCDPAARNRYRGATWRCDRYALYNIDLARRREGLGRLRLPAGYRRLDPGAELTAVTNAERRSRGLLAVLDSSRLDTTASVAASHLSDPVGPPGRVWVSNWSGGYRTPLAADYAWMYDDGVGGSNAGCQTSGAAACWDHRHAILSHFSGHFGGGRALVGGMWSYAQLFVAG